MSLLLMKIADFDEFYNNIFLEKRNIRACSARHHVFRRRSTTLCMNEHKIHDVVMSM